MLKRLSGFPNHKNIVLSSRAGDVVRLLLSIANYSRQWAPKNLTPSCGVVIARSPIGRQICYRDNSIDDDRDNSNTVRRF
jgi:hypothetical protein